MLSHVAATRQYAADAPPFERFDLVLYNEWAYAWGHPRPGDVVLARFQFGRNFGAGQAEDHRRYAVREDEVIDRIVGVPGDRVVWDGTARCRSTGQRSAGSP